MGYPNGRKSLLAGIGYGKVSALSIVGRHYTTQAGGSAVKSRWIEHKGKRILYIDYANFGRDLAGLKAESDAVVGLVSRQPEGSILGLTDVQGTMFSAEVVDIIKKSGAVVGKYLVRRKHAIIGISGVRMVIYQAITRVLGEAPKLFDSAEQAMDWLVGPE
jgi:hypothetical protein